MEMREVTRMDLFSANFSDNIAREAPLASRMRPRNLNEFIGQDDIVGVGKLLRRAIEADRLSSMIFYGPPGTGKTTLAKIIANTTSSYFESLNAVTAGVADIRRVIAEALDRIKLYQQKTILFIDEIHRFNKSQQDALLPAVEEGTILLIGATTENPLYEVNTPLISRSMIFRFHSLGTADLKKLIQVAIADQERGVGDFRVNLHDDALEHLAQIANGDGRIALNALELAALTTPIDIATNQRELTLEIISDCVQQRPLRYDRNGQAHYDTISAFIKSMRGSDPDAALYYLALMLTAGEDPKFIARRLIVHAAEDVGMADPMALLVATAAAQAVEMVGLPEARIPMAQAVIHIATAPKSNAGCAAIGAALARVQEIAALEIPTHLRDSSHPGARKLGDGLGYQYPHDFPNGFVDQAYLPSGLTNQVFYHPTQHGSERQIDAHLKNLWPGRYDKDND